MSEDYKGNRAFSDQFLPEIQRIIAPLLIAPADIKYDTQEATDLMLIEAKDKRIACRVRRPYAMPYRYQFTMRYKSQVRCFSEYHKISLGFGDWMFYGIAAADNKTLQYWNVIDLKAWRFHMVVNRDQISSGVKRNQNDPTEFMWFDLRTFPKNPPPEPAILIASSNPEDYP